MGDILVLAVLIGAVLLASRSLRKSRKRGGCSGNCGSCSCGCSKQV